MRFLHRHKIMRLSICIALLASTLLIASCLDPTAVGSDLLDQDRADIGFTDTVAVKATTISKDSIRTYSPFTTNQLDYYLFGSYIDPVFGKVSSSIYAQIYPETRTPQFADATPDSIVLILPYYQQGTYGNTQLEPFNMEVFRISEKLLKDGEYFSNQEIAIDPISLGNGQSMYRPDSLPFIDYSGLEADTLLLSFFRVSLPLSLAEELLSLDSLTYRSDSLFFEAFKGLHLRPSNTINGGGMLSFDLLSIRAGLYLFYRDAEDRPRRFLYSFLPSATVRFATYEHDYNGSKALPFINKPIGADSLLFVQGMSGLETKLEIPSAESLQGLIVNKAELEIYVATLDGDSPTTYPPISQLVLSFPNSEGQLEVVEDIRIIQARRLSLSNVFGGTPTGGTNGQPLVYKMNITAHFQRVIDGVVGNTLYITPVRGGETAARTVLYGPGHPQYSMKLKLAFTRL